MRNIDHKALARLVKESSFLLASFGPERFPDNNRRRSWQLTCGKKINVKAGAGSFERLEWHLVTFGELPDVPPAVYMHTSYSHNVAIKRLLLDEIDESRKHGRAPSMFAHPASWSDEGKRAATFTIAASGTDRELSGACYNVEIGSATLTVAGFEFKRADEYGPAHWTKQTDDETDPKYARFAYGFQIIEPTRANASA